MDMLTLIFDFFTPRQRLHYRLVCKGWTRVLVQSQYWDDPPLPTFRNHPERREPLGLYLAVDQEGRRYLRHELGLEDGPVRNFRTFRERAEERPHMLEGLIAPEELEGLPDAPLSLLVREFGLQALAERLISIEEAKAMPFQYLDLLMSRNGVRAMRDGLITPMQVRGRGLSGL
jgi:hypothetical protein